MSRPIDPTRRFSNRVDDYSRYRPSYPPQVLETLQRECGLTPDVTIADVGCGTGLLARLFCDFGNRVYGVEPNTSMLASARESLRDHGNFVAVEGKAEATTLPDTSVDFIVAGQAFHWFETLPTRQEFTRILKPGGWVVLLWNDRREDTPFMAAYEELMLRFGIDYAKVKRMWAVPHLAEFFAPSELRAAFFGNEQSYDREGLRGRILSASYMPSRDHPAYEAMSAAIDRLFDAHQRGGTVLFQQETRMYYGQLERR